MTCRMTTKPGSTGGEGGAGACATPCGPAGVGVRMVRLPAGNLASAGAGALSFLSDFWVSCVGAFVCVGTVRCGVKILVMGVCFLISAFRSKSG